jgi:hypothetical protein
MVLRVESISQLKQKNNVMSKKQTKQTTKVTSPKLPKTLEAVSNDEKLEVLEYLKDLLINNHNYPEIKVEGVRGSYDGMGYSLTKHYNSDDTDRGIQFQIEVVGVGETPFDTNVDGDIREPQMFLILPKGRIRDYHDFFSYRGDLFTTLNECTPQFEWGICRTNQHSPLCSNYFEIHPTLKEEFTTKYNNKKSGEEWMVEYDKLREIEKQFGEGSDEWKVQKEIEVKYNKVFSQWGILHEDREDERCLVKAEQIKERRSYKSKKK